MLLLMNNIILTHHQRGTIYKHTMPELTVVKSWSKSEIDRFKSVRIYQQKCEKPIQHNTANEREREIANAEEWTKKIPHNKTSQL